MTRGWRLQYLIVAGVLFVGAVSVVAAREHFPTLFVSLLVLGVLAAVALLIALTWRKR
jgi:hypothetical protein